MTRSRDAAASRASILAAARDQFGRLGFERTTIRSVATEAAVDPALVMHYFGSKNGLFAAVSELEIDLPDLTGVAPDRVADVLFPVFARLWGPDGPLLPMLRAAATSPVAAATLQAVFQDRVEPAIAVVARNRPAERAALVAGQFLGVAVARFVVGLAAFTEMDDATLVAWLRPVVAQHLTGRAPARRGPGPARSA